MPEQLKNVVIFGVADVGKRLRFLAEVEGSPRLMRLPAVHGITAPKYHGLIMHGSHMSVRKKSMCKLRACWGPLGPGTDSKTLRLFPRE